MSDEKMRLQDEYDKRRLRFADSDVYSVFNPSTIFAIHQRQRVTLKLLKKYGLSRLADISIFEMGCGDGRVLAEYLSFGATPKKLHGVDLLFDRLVHAQKKLPGSAFANADGRLLPLPDASFDLILQSTAISSILDSNLRQGVCAELLRVLKPDGIILWYDFWLNPTNPQTHGIRPAEIRRLFPQCSFDFHKITLAPPLARRLVPISWGMAYFLEGLRIFNTHYLAVISPKREISL